MNTKFDFRAINFAKFPYTRILLTVANSFRKIWFSVLNNSPHLQTWTNAEMNIFYFIAKLRLFRTGDGFYSGTWKDKFSLSIFFSHQMLLIANYRLSHLKIRMMGAKSPKTNFIAEKKRARKVTGRLWSFSRPSSYPWLQRY